ncbi:M61 family metallopeptidase [Candidatus Thioglobus autotrophicus]|uniref:M61 family metallopeptidase n=1 Tax=Candidatus Thioglobus autotrophicus TaxID=1705394 RepID=UPI00299D29A8|nr:peptidase M61 [Candidatus Thioglobus autotrophicus]WPE18757.1 peptidase M61 [Candidatus Thioglobus autotrophicus]
MAIKYKITPKNLHAHVFEVELILQNPNPLGQVFSLPSWIPGSYLVRDFAKNIVSIQAHGAGQLIPIKKLDKNHWITSPCSDEITLSYEVYAFDLSVRSAYLTNERAFFNGTSVFLLPLGFEAEKCELCIVPAQSSQTLGEWSCATGLKKVAELNFEAPNYQDLVDHPVEMADFTLFDFQVAGVEHQMAITGVHNTDIARLKQDLKTICNHHVGFFNNDTPFDDYLFLTLVKTKGYGGLEHKNSTSLICSRKELPTPKLVDINKDYTRFLALCSHEYFHAWWVKTIKPASFFELDLSRENYTEQLWIFEGFTSYYDELSLLRTKLLTPEQYLDLFAQTITRVQKSKGRLTQSLAQSSYDAWTKFYQQDENAPNAIVSYYTKGALLAFVLDMQIRQQTGNTKSLDDVLRNAWENYQACGLENNTIQTIVAQITDTDFSEFFEDYLYGVKELPLQASFDYVGIECQFVKHLDDLSDFGLTIKTKGEFSQIIQVFADSSAQHAGLYVGDKIVSVNYQQLKDKALIAEINKQKFGEVIKIGVLRDELLLEIPVLIGKITPTFCKLNTIDKLDEQITQQQRQWFYQE